MAIQENIRQIKSRVYRHGAKETAARLKAYVPAEVSEALDLQHGDVIVWTIIREKKVAIVKKLSTWNKGS